MTLQLVSSSDSAPTQPAQPVPLGSITPRLWTRPLRPLTPDTSYGFRVIWFAAFVLGEPLDAWQQWAVIHLGELLPDGRPRFRQVLIIVARQQGKTHLCKVLALYWLFVERQPLVFGTSTDREQAREAWQAAVDTAGEVSALAARSRRPRIGNGQEVFPTTERCAYKIGASNRKGGRGKSIDRQIGDELREHHSWEAYNAAHYAMNARPYGQAVYITNQGDVRSVVLNSLRSSAIDYINTGEGDPRLGLLEWSAPPGTHPMDTAGWAAANPQLGRRMDPAIIAGAAGRVAKPGADPEELAGFLTEVLCMEVPNLQPAIDGAAFRDSGGLAGLDDVRDRVAMCLDVAPNLQHAVLYAAARLDTDRVGVDFVREWSGADVVRQLAAQLPGIVAAAKPRVFGWLPQGPAAAVAAQLRDRRDRAGRGRAVASWPPRGVKVEEITAETPAVCMGFAALILARGVQHTGDPLLTAQSEQVGKGPGTRWVFVRKDGGSAAAVYAAAGAVHLAQTMPALRPVSRGAR